MSRPREGKRPKQRFFPTPRKAPHSADIGSTNAHQISWHIGVIDFEPPWCAGLDRSDILQRLEETLKNFESRTWEEILGGSQNHAVDKDALHKAARDRLSEIDQDDCDAYVSLRFTGTQRVWGIRQGSIFRILWWDPNHKVCPSQKRHT